MRMRICVFAYAYTRMCICVCAYKVRMRWTLISERYCMGGHISQKWYEFTTGDQEISCYCWVYQLVIETVDCCNWDNQLVVEIVDHYGWDYRPKSDWILRLTIAMVEKKIGVWKQSRDWWSSTLWSEWGEWPAGR